MKKALILLSVALALASCVKTQDVFSPSPEARQIAFSPLAQPATKTASDTYAGPITDATFPTDLNMYVAAYQVSPSAATYFNGTQFVYNNAGGAAGSSGFWGGATARYWPLSAAYINFLAYANVTGEANFDVTTPASQATISQTDNHSAQTDLMYAIGHGQVTENGNVLVFPEKVDMAFKHAQAWISFAVRAATSVERDITVNSITLNGAKYAGTYVITHTNYNASSSQSVAGAWTPSGVAQNVEVPGWSAAALTTSFVTVGNGLMIVPDDAADGDFTSFTVNYTYDDKIYDYTFTPVNTSVDQAKHYIYDITFKLNEIYVAATVTEWDDQVISYVDVPVKSIAAASASPTIEVPATAGVYTFCITGLTSGDAISVAKTDASNIIDGDPVLASATADTNGIATISFTIKANDSSERSATITLTDTNDSTKNTTVTISQAAAE